MAEKRKTYTIATSKSSLLSRSALKMTDKLEKNVPKQLILDTLVGFLKDPAVYKEVQDIVSKEIA